MADPSDRKKIDDDWKTQAAREKAELQQSQAKTAENKPQEAPPERPPGGSAEAPPEADFLHLVAGLRAQALIALGLVEDPVHGRLEANPDQAKYLIDTLAVLERKTVGNLSADEKAFLDAALFELRMNFLRA